MTGSGVAKSMQPYSHLSCRTMFTRLRRRLLNSFTFGFRADRQFNDWGAVKLPLNFQQAGVQGIAVPDPVIGLHQHLGRIHGASGLAV